MDKETIIDYCNKANVEDKEYCLEMGEVMLPSLTDSEISDIAKNCSNGYLKAVAKTILGNRNWLIDHNNELRKKNLPIQNLLDFYKDKKSKRVVEARKELRKRFEYQDGDVQMSIINAMLDGSSDDRIWCYKRLYTWYQPEFEVKIQNLWQQYGEDLCARLVIKHLPDDFVLQEIDKLSQKDENYYHLCRRLSKCAPSLIDKDRLYCLSNHMQYLWIISQSKIDISLEEIESIFYVQLYVLIYDFLYRDFRPYPFGKQDSVSKYRMSKIPEIKKMLSSIFTIGYVDFVRDFLALDNEVHHNYAEYYYAGNHVSRYTDHEECNDTTDREYLWFAIDLLPEEYQKLIPKEKNDLQQASDSEIQQQPFNGGKHVIDVENTEKLKEDPILGDMMDKLDLFVEDPFGDVPF